MRQQTEQSGLQSRRAIVNCLHRSTAAARQCYGQAALGVRGDRREPKRRAKP